MLKNKLVIFVEDNCWQEGGGVVKYSPPAGRGKYIYITARWGIYLYKAFTAATFAVFKYRRRILCTLHIAVDF
jgi:hypothetical protein